MAKPTLRVRFDANTRPNRPGLWLCRKSVLIQVLNVEPSDIERSKHDPEWIGDIEWAAQLELSDADVVPLDQRSIAAHLDTEIVGWRKKVADIRTANVSDPTSSVDKLVLRSIELAQSEQAVATLQSMRYAFLGEMLE